MLKRKEEEKRPSVPKGKEKRVLCVMSYIFVQCDSNENRKRNEIKMKENRKREMIEIA